MKLSDRIYSCRRKAGLSQEALAEKLGVSRQAVGKWENGDATPDANRLLALARIFGVSTDWLLGGGETEAARESHDARRTAARDDTLARDLEKLPGFFGRLVRKYGWIYGVYQAAGGFVLCLFGILIKAMGRTAERMSGGMTDFGLTGDVTVYDEAGGIMDFSELSPGAQEAIRGALDIPGQSPFSLSSPFDLMGNFVILIGAAIILAGLLLAWYLRRLDGPDQKR